MSTPEGPLWRVFPCDPDVTASDPFSPEFLPPGRGQGRFDLADVSVPYLAETPEHAVAEKLQVYRGQVVGDPELHEFGRRLTLVRIDPEGGPVEVPDLCDPRILSSYRIRPDALAAASRATTQAIARRLRRHGADGLRWWSALRGEWHTVVLFDPPPFTPAPGGSANGSGLRLLYGQLTPLTLTTLEVLNTARDIGVTLP